MVIYSCEREWDAMLTCIYDAWSDKRGHKNIRLELEPLNQLSFFDEYIHVDADPVKAQKVIDAVCMKISRRFYAEISYTAMAYEEDVLDNIYRVMILGFAYGDRILDALQYKDIVRHREISKRVGSETHHFIEFIRFHEVDKNVYVAHIEPKSRVIFGLASHFADRMPSEYWIIVDDIHKEAIIHPKDEQYFHQKLSNDEFERLLQTEKENDEYTDMWKVFFDSIAIRERMNKKCQDNLFPIWTRKHAVEFL